MLPVKCGVCGLVRTDEPDYSPIQLILGQEVGWYSGDDGEICPKDMQELFNKANGL